MAPTKTLPIYRDATILVKQLHESTRKAPRDLRFTLVQNLLGEAVEICVDIVTANRAGGPDRAARLAVLASRITRVEVLLMVAIDQRCISKGAAANAMQHLDALGRQTAGWARATKTPVTPAARAASSM